MTLPLTRADLDLKTCGEPNCEHDHSILYFAASCHPSAPLRVRYVKATGALEVLCAVCDRVGTTVQVATRPPGVLQ